MNKIKQVFNNNDLPPEPKITLSPDYLYKDKPTIEIAKWLLWLLVIFASVGITTILVLLVSLIKYGIW